MNLLDGGRVIVGLVLLIVGGDLLVRGASALAGRVGISSLVVGLTVVSAATSSPELAVSVGSVLHGEPALALGNVVGSNIANVLFVLGASALVLPLVAGRQLVRFDLPVMAALSVLLLVVSMDGRIGTVDGGILFCAVVVHSGATVCRSRREARAPVTVTGSRGDLPVPGCPEECRPPPPAGIGPSLLLVVFGVGLLVAGATLLVEGAVGIATAWGISSLVVGLTVVAVGTSLPELATSVIAVLHDQRDLAVGNVVGSNIFNIGLVLGLPALVLAGDLPVPSAALALDLPVMLAASVALLSSAFTRLTVARWEGGLFLALYVAYLGFLVLTATEHDALEGFTAVMVWFVLPLSAMTLLAFTAQEIGGRRRRRRPRRTADSP